VPVEHAGTVTAPGSPVRIGPETVARAAPLTCAHYLPVLRADETTGRAAGALSYVHVACTEYLTLMHVGDRSTATIDAGGVLPAFTGVLVRDGYHSYCRLPAVHAWCGAHYADFRIMPILRLMRNEV
jgi:hypothetical protein